MTRGEQSKITTLTKDERIEQIKKTFCNKITNDILQVRLLLAETTPWSPGHWTPSRPGEPHGDYGDGDGLVDGEPHSDYDEDAAAEDDHDAVAADIDGDVNGVGDDYGDGDGDVSQYFLKLMK